MLQAAVPQSAEVVFTKKFSYIVTIKRGMTCAILVLSALSIPGPPLPYLQLKDPGTPNPTSTHPQNCPQEP